LICSGGGGETDRQKERDRKRETEKERQKERDRKRETERERQKERDRQRETDRQTETDTMERDRERPAERDRQACIHADGQTDRQIERDRERHKMLTKNWIFFSDRFSRPDDCRDPRIAKTGKRSDTV
jgi:hypothetical protein